MEDYIPPKQQAKVFVNPIIPMELPQKEDLEPNDYIDHTSCNTLGDSTSGKFVIKITRFESSISEEWIIFVDIVQKALVG